MSQNKVDYSKSLIYKLESNNKEISQTYVGSTTNFRQRKRNHKHDCNTETRKSYNCQVYQFIRSNGGWENWDMNLIEYFPCNTKLELHTRERYWVKETSSTLNKQIPSRTQKERDSIRIRTSLQKKAHHEKHKEWLLAHPNYNDKYKEQVKCECGGTYTLNHKKRHFKTKKHQGIMPII